MPTPTFSALKNKWLGWRRRALINHKLAFEDTVFGRVRAGEVCERAAP
jgi:hypothetical protein